MRNLRQLVSLQVGRGLAAVMVVGHHPMSLLGRDPRYWHRASLANRFDGLQLGVEYFFVLSGVVMLIAHWGVIGINRKVSGHISGRGFGVYIRFTGLS